MMHLHQSLVFITVLTFSYSSSSNACPPRCRSCDGGRVMCAGAGLTAPPPSINEDTYSVDLSRNSITSLAELPPMPNVQSMRMSMNKVSVISDGAFSSASSIMRLDLSINEISTIHDNGLRGLESLLSISLNGNKLSSIGGAFEHIKSVTSIRLSNNQIEEIKDKDFMHNTMVKMLDLSNNQINAIEANAFKNLNMLRYLILSNNPIKQLPELTFTSTMLSLADFSNCLLEHVPRKMPPSLNDLRLGNNKITKIFYKDFQNITNLNLLTLNDNKISEVEHRSFKGLENLKELWMSRNEMVYIPRGLPKNLAKFHIDNNQVVDFQPTMFVEDAKLKHLSLEANKVQKMHKDALKNVKELEHLNLQGNRLSFIEAGTITRQPALKSLKLTNNPIQVFEKGAFSGLSNLTEISLSYVDYPLTGAREILEENFLGTMPNVTDVDLMSSVHLTKKLLALFEKPNAPVMDKVTTLNLQYDELTTLPMNIKHLFPHIENLWLDGNLFICDTKLRWLHDWMQRSPIKFYQYEEPTCDVPLALKGKTFSEISAADFTEIPKDEQVHFTVPATPTQPNVPEKLVTENRGTASENTNKPETNVNRNPDNTRKGQLPNTNSRTNTQQIQESGPTQNKQNKQESQSSTNQQNPYRYDPPSRSNPVTGTKVIIKPPRNFANTNTRPTTAQTAQKKHKMTKAERKAARAAARAAKKAERQRRRRERQNARKRRHRKGKDARRKKRRIRANGKKRCKLDKDGNMKCRKRKRCKVDAEGNVKCRKRKRKQASDNGQNKLTTTG